MPWDNVPPVQDQDLQDWQWLSQFWHALRERHAVLSDGFNWPPGGIVWNSGTVAGITQDDDDNNLVVDCGVVDWSPYENCSSQRWVDYTCTLCSMGWMPAYYDLVIHDPADLDDPFTVVRGAITAQDWSGSGEVGTLTIDGVGILDAVTGGFIESVDSLVGLEWLIVKRGALTSTERLPDKPNDNTLWIGSDSDGGTVTDPDTGDVTSYLHDPHGAWTPDQFAGCDLLVRADGLLRRVSITHNTSNKLTFDQQDWTGSGQYIILDAGGVGQPGRKAWHPYRWYYGLTESAYSHRPDDSLGAAAVRSTGAYWDEGYPCSSPPDECKSVFHPSIDTDLTIDYQDVCESARAGDNLTPDYYKSWRAVQVDALGLSSAFADLSVTAPSNFTPSTVLAYCGINSGTSSLAYDSDANANVWSFTVDTAYAGYPVYWTVRARDGNSNRASGQDTPDDSGTVTVSGFTATDDPDTTDVGLDVIYSAGFTRVFPYQVQYWHAKTCFIPDYRVLDDGSITVIDPPDVALAVDGDGHTLDYYDCNGRGTWFPRPKSAQPVQPSTQTSFVTGRYYRFIGDNYGDPTVSPRIKPGDTLDPMRRYYDHYYRGRLSDPNQGAIDVQRNGTVASGTATSLTAANMNWWQDWANGSFITTTASTITAVVPYTPADNTTTPPTPEVPGTATCDVGSAPYTPINLTFTVTDTDGTEHLSGSWVVPGGSTDPVDVPGRFTSDMVGDTITVTFHGALRVESGTATGGSTTTLIDGTKDTTDNTQPFGCWWSNSRFPGVSSAYTGFILEVSTTDGDGVSTGYKVPITSTEADASGVTIHFDAVPGLTVASGDTYSIREPAYEVDKWAGRVVNIGTNDKPPLRYTATIDHSDDDTLYWSTLYDSDGHPVSDVEVQAGWRFSINDEPYGGVWKWDGAKFIDPAGTDDAVRLGVPSDPHKFLSDPTCNLESFDKGYGLQQVADVITITQYREVYNVINAMQKTIHGAGWDNRPSPTADAEENLRFGENNLNRNPPDPHYYYTFAQAQTEAENAWEAGGNATDPYYSTTYAGFGDSEVSSGAPYSSAQVFADAEEATHESDGSTWYPVDVALQDRYAYEVVTGVPTVLPATVDFLAYAIGIGAKGDTQTMKHYSGTTYTTSTLTDEDRFTGGTESLAYYQWRKVSSGSVDSDGTCYSADKVGGTRPTATDPGGDQYHFTSGADASGWNGAITSGYQVTDQKALVTWSFDYTGDTTSSGPTARRPVRVVHPVVKLPAVLPVTWRPGQGSALWADLHGHVPTGDAVADRAWLSSFGLRVPCGSCRTSWASWVNLHPPRVDSLDGWRRWTVAAHNDVNERLGREPVTLAQAAERWGWTEKKSAG